jgi:hypothetical protein
LRKSCGLSYENGYWKINMNKEYYNNLNIQIFFLCLQHGLWNGSGVLRMDGERVEKRVLEDKSGGRSKEGKPRGRWMIEVKLEGGQT